MGSNVEIKARVDDPRAFAERAAAVAGGEPQELHQIDVFFRCSRGRLKLRRFPEGHGELIHYVRPDDSGPKRSAYSIHPTADAGSLERVLCDALEVSVTVRKRRQVWLTGQTRIHLDRVDGLGDFAELEVVLRDGQSADEGRRIASELMRRLGILDQDLVDVAYADLLERGCERAERST